MATETVRTDRVRNDKEAREETVVLADATGEWLNELPNCGRLTLTDARWFAFAAKPPHWTLAIGLRYQ
jgi:hypothetical protein